MSTVFHSFYARNAEKYVLIKRWKVGFQMLHGEGLARKLLHVFLPYKPGKIVFKGVKHVRGEDLQRTDKS